LDGVARLPEPWKSEKQLKKTTQMNCTQFNQKCTDEDATTGEIAEKVC